MAPVSGSWLAYCSCQCLHVLTLAVQLGCRLERSSWMKVTDRKGKQGREYSQSLENPSVWKCIMLRSWAFTVSQ